MAKKELFIKRVHDIVNELKIPMIDKRVYDRVDVQESRAMVTVRFVFDEDESVIRGFLTLAEYYRTVVLAVKEIFYIVHDGIVFKLESK
jgi:hypothetical protein